MRTGIAWQDSQAEESDQSSEQIFLGFIDKLTEIGTAADATAADATADVDAAVDVDYFMTMSC